MNFTTQVHGVPSQKVTPLRESGTRNIVVAGGAGFLGSHLCLALLRQGHRVYCVDSLLTGRYANIEGNLNHPKFTFISHDVTEPLAIDGPVDEIYNLACAASPPLYQIDPVHTFRTNVLGAMNLLDLAKRKGARILQASTSEVYGDPTISPQVEGYHGNVNTFGPRSCYDEGKRGAETLFHDYHFQYGVSVRVARIFNTYGPGMREDDGRVIPNFAMQAMAGEDITVYGDGTQTRSFCYVSDLIAGLMGLMAAPDEIYFPVNLGNPEEYNMLELAHHIIDLTGSTSKIVFRELPVDDPKQRCPDISAAQRHLGWSPTVGCLDGLRRTLPYFATGRRDDASVSEGAATVMS